MGQIALYDGEASSATHQDEDDIYLARRYVARIVAYWAIVTVLHTAYAITNDPMITIGWAFYVGAPALAIGFLVGLCLRSMHAALQVAIILLQIEAAFTLFQLVSSYLAETSWDPSLVGASKALIAALVCVPRLFRLRDNARYSPGLGLALLALLGGIVAQWQSDEIKIRALEIIGSFQKYEPPQRSFALSTPIDTIWEAQPELIRSAFAASADQPKRGGQGVYIVSLALSGRDDAIRREAQLALAALDKRYGDDVRLSLLMSNHGDDTLQAPLATVGNLDRVAQAIAKEADPARDLAVIYMVSSFSQDATSVTSMLNSSGLEWFSATNVKQFVSNANVAGAVIVVSSCYSGSWLNHLQDDNLIVISSTMSNDGSVGCANTGSGTQFGDAFIGRDLEENVPFGRIFETAKRTLTDEELAQEKCRTNPQAFVGGNMRELWDGPLERLTTNLAPCTIPPSA